MVSEPSVRDSVNQAIYRDVEEIANFGLSLNVLSDVTVMITGANGFIGRTLTLALLAMNDIGRTNIKVLAAVRDKSKASKVFGDILKRDDIRMVEQDVRDPFDQPCADHVIHAASPASAADFERDPAGTMDTNLKGTDNVLRYASECKPRSVLFISSLKVYGSVPYGGNGKLSEGSYGTLDHADPKNCYAVGKREAEALCVRYHEQYGVPVKIVRPAYVYGAASLSDDRVWAQFLANAVRREDILLKSSGNALRSFVYVTDAVSAILKVMQCGKDAQPYNISSEDSDVTIRDFAQNVVDAFPERKLKLAFRDPKDEAHQVLPPKYMPEVLDSTLLEQLGWSAHVTLSEGIERSVSILEAAGSN